jgi:hypothetical protein
LASDLGLEFSSYRTQKHVWAFSDSFDIVGRAGIYVTMDGWMDGWMDLVIPHFSIYCFLSRLNVCSVLLLVFFVITRVVSGVDWFGTFEASTDLNCKERC